MAESESRSTRRSNALERVSDAVVSLNTDLEYIFANSQAKELLDIDEEKLIGASIWELFPTATETIAEDSIREALETGEKRSYERYNERLGRWFEARIFPDEKGLSIFFTDVSEQKQIEAELTQINEQITTQNQALGSFADIVSDPERSVSRQITDLLELGIAYLDLNVGIVSDIEETTYTVRESVTPDNTITSGDVFDLGDTFCSLVYEADGPVSFHTPTNGGVKEHPAYRNQGIESYVGVPIRVDDERYGTLNFSSSTAREDPITEGEESFVRILAEWISAAIERRHHQRNLKRTSEMFKQTQEIANIGGWELDLQSETLQWSDEVYRIHDLPLDVALTPEDGIEFYHPDDRDTIKKAFDRLTTEGEPYNLELRIVTAADEVRWVRTNGKPRYEHNEIVAVHGTLQDITERKEREQELQELTERFELAVNGANIGIWDWDMTTDEVTYNEQWAQMLGYSIEEIEPHLDEWKQRAHPEDLAAVEETLDNHIAGETDCYETEHRMRTADGDWKWIRDTGRIVERDEAGEPVRAVGIHIDIDEQKTYEQTLKDQRNDLKVLNQMVRHDIRNNLHIVVSYAKMLTDAVENEGAEYLQNIIDSGSEAIDITQTAGEVTKAMLRSEADLTPRNLQSVLEGEIAQARENHERGIVSAEESLPDVSVMADEMLESVFRNLLINAITHNDKEVAEVAISATIDEEVVRVRIADNGPGIPDTQKGQIFCEGEKGIDSGGTGMGLYLVQTLVDRYDGAVWVEDNEPEGSVFIVELRCE